ncbi:MAG: hypothetical protein D6720_06170 [Gammaproteobacteria bacterium]|nr:MAG: hypothetical protein D6720_06170 [Gammaproteobacteria bacterium]
MLKRQFSRLPFAGLFLVSILCANAWALPRCFFVSSYHQGYSWSDGVQRGLEKVLQGKCELRQFDMDTKRHKSDADKRAAALAAKQLIESWKPDVVITADDNAARYLIVPYYKDAALPFVFCGVNWSVEEYGFPFENVTGMIEVAPVRAMLKEARRLRGDANHFFYLGADTTTERKNLARFRKAAEDLGLTMESALVDTPEAWIEAFEKAQRFPFVAIGSHAGINGWDFEAVRAAIQDKVATLSVTNHEWMMPVTMLGFTKIPEEQGEWAGETALAILEGVSPGEIPIVANRRWDLWLNEGLVKLAGIRLPDKLRAKAKRWQKTQ